MGETYYDVLEVDPEATRDEIESAYRERVLETHPDHSDDPDAAEQFQRVTTAKSVLTDGTERARYDRLGHESYVGLAQGHGARESDDSSHERDESEQSASDTHQRTRQTSAGENTTGDRTESSSTGSAGSTGTASESSGTDGRRTNANTRGPSEWAERVRTNADSTQAGTGRTDQTESHHARQRSERRRKRAKRRAAGEWPFDSDDPSPSSGATTPPGETEDTRESAATEYSVHDWDGEVDLEWEGPALDRTTAVSVGAVALLYPLFVAASLTPLFSLPVNAIIAACTLALVGYLLTMPRIAIAAFGGWCVLFPVGMAWSSVADPLSLFGLLALGFAWIPFGYAVALWWILRP